MSSTIRNSGVLLAAVLAVAGCGQEQAAAPMADDATASAESVARGEAAADLPGRIDPAPVAADRSRVVAHEDIEVNGEPACTITVRYAGRLDQDVTWNGEPCSEITFGFRTLGGLEKIGQADGLDEETRDDLERLSGGRVFYVEGRFASAIYPLNVAGFPREVWLAD